MKKGSRQPRIKCEGNIRETFNKPMDKLSLGFEAAKYKVSIKSSPVFSNNVSYLVIFVNFVMVY